MQLGSLSRLAWCLALGSGAALMGCAVETEEGLSVQQTEQKVIYGAMNRVEAAAANDPRVAEWARATAIVVSRNTWDCDSKDCALPTGTYASANVNSTTSLPLCPSELFAGQPQAGGCSAFLVAPDLVATAGHCFDSCTDVNFVFGFETDASGANAPSRIPAKDIYACQEIVQRVKSGNQDFNLVRLDRPARDRRPFKVRREGTLSSDATLAVLGHPVGLPLKFADNGSVRSGTSGDRFYTNLDILPGNSGSPVVNLATGEVEGIQVTGPTGVGYYKTSTDSDGNACASELRCTDSNGCQEGWWIFNAPWVGVTRIGMIADAIPETACVFDTDCTDAGAPSCVAARCNEDNVCEQDDSACECLTSSDCDDGRACTQDMCFNDRTCFNLDRTCTPRCTEESAIDLGSPGAATTVANNACVRVRDGYPSWWGSSRTMAMQPTGASDYPLSYTYSQDCGGQGSGSLSGNWTTSDLPGINDDCATLIHLGGDGSENVTLRYYAK